MATDLGELSNGDDAPTEWRTLYSHGDPAKVEAVWLALRSMEYPARLADRTGPIEAPSHRPDGVDDDDAVDVPRDVTTHPPQRESDRTPTHIEVPIEHVDELAEVLEEIVDEQAELDDALARLEVERQRRQRLIAAVICVGFLVMIISMRVFG